MKILRIKLKNLNSLRGEQVVDFETGPLSHSGLFAITGPTGAGKSTILDAITLALYGHAARYGTEANPEDMMSRHCGECRAEVEFLVPKGRYRAEWQMRRARGKADGVMQAPKRYVYDATGQVLAASIREAEDKIRDLVGLDYERFLRSVLLAQGEFARFLKANSNERAALLESLTGTEIYSELSKLAYAVTTRRELELTTQEEKLGAVALLTEEDRNQRDTQIKEQRPQLNQKKVESAKLIDQLAQAKELQKALTSEADLVQQQQKLAGQYETAAPDLQRLRQHRLTMPYSEDLGQLDAAALHATEQGQKLKTAEEERRERHWQWITGVVAADELATNLINQEKEAIRKTEESIKDHEGQKLQTRKWLDDHDRDKSLETDLPDLAEQFGRLGALRRDSTKAREKAADLAAKIKAQQERVESAQAALSRAQEQLRSKQSEKVAAAKSVEALLQGKSETKRAAELQEIRTQIEAIGKLLENEQSCLQQQSKLQRDRKKLAGLKPEISKAEAALKEVISKKKAATNDLALHQAQFHQAELVASLEEHRAVLKSGESCPLCGATEHPLLHKKQRLVSVSAIEAALEKAKKKLAAVEDELETAREAVTSKKATQSNLKEGLDNTEAELKEARKRIQILAKANALAATDAEALEKLRTKKSTRKAELQETLNQIRKASETLGIRETARLKTENEFKLAEQARADKEKDLRSLQSQTKEQSALVGSLESGVTATSGSLNKLLRSYEVALPELGHEQATCGKLKQRKTDYQTQAERLRQLATALDTEKVALESSRKSAGAIQQEAARFQEAKATHQEDVRGVDSKASRGLQSRWKSLDDAERALKTLETTLNNAVATANQRKGDVANASERLKKCGNQLASRLTGSAFASVEALRASKLEAADAARVQKDEEELKAGAERLRGSLDTERKRIAALRDAKAAEGEAVARLESNKEALQSAIEELVRSIDRLEGQLKEDQSNREQHAAKAAQLEQDRKRLHVWRQLQGLIGSADGAKFRRYAQGISLDVLLRNGNEHLKGLSDRYRLQRQSGEELELRIEDLYQAGTTRPMASLSGGESFLASLALALGLADLAGRNVRIDSLFIDEGFGALDAETLDLAISTLETLRQDNKTVGVISHVDLLKERIGTRIVVEKHSGGTSILRIAS